MLISSLLLIPIVGISIILIIPNYLYSHSQSLTYISQLEHIKEKGIFKSQIVNKDFSVHNNTADEEKEVNYNTYKKTNLIKSIALFTSIINLFVSIILFLLFNFSSNQFQFVQEHYKINSFDLYLGVDGISIYFVILTTIIIPIALLSN